MNARDLMDATRESWVSDDAISPTRSIVYKRTSDDVEVTINSFVGGGNFNKEEKDTIENYESFSALNLTQKPQINDTVTYNGDVFKVKRYAKLGSLYTVYGYMKRHNGRPTT